MPVPFQKEIVIEIERCVDCHTHTYCTRHEEVKYCNAIKLFKNKLRDLVPELSESQFTENPGPKARGIQCKQNEFNPALWVSVTMDPNTRRWNRDQVFRYPRLGAFEVVICKGRVRKEVFSKLKTMKWANAEWLADQVKAVVDDQMNGWGPAEEEVKKPAKKYAGVDGKMTMTDEDLRNIVSKKFKQITAAFRAFDKNGDGMVNKSEFMIGLKESKIDLPPSVMNQLWRMADEDNSGNLNYQEFVRKFTNIKHSHSLHRHANLSTAADAKMEQLHGVGAGSRMARTTQHRSSENTTYTIDESQFSTEPTEATHHTTISALARDKNLSKLHVEECTPDQLRAKMYNKHGNLVTAFRQMDNSGDSRICFEEFKAGLPKALGEPLSFEKTVEFWRAMDTDMTGEIDMSEFASSACKGHLATKQGVAVFKDMAIDVTSGQVPDHLKDRGALFGVKDMQKRPHPSTAGEHKVIVVAPDALGRPESASTIATAASPTPQ